MTTKGSREPPVAVQAVGLVADGLTSALARFVRVPREGARGEPEPTTPPVAPSPRARPPAPVESGPGAARRAARGSARAAGALIGTVASGLVPVVVRSLDPNEVLERVDVQQLVDRVDVQALVRRVDVNEVVESVDVNRVIDRVDLDEVVQRIDMGPVAREALEGIDMGELIRESTASIGTDTLEALRVRGMRVDDGLARIVDRLLRRSEPRDTELGPR